MKITYLLYDGITALDVVGSYEFLCRVPQAKIQFVGIYKGEIKTDTAALRLHTDFVLDDIKSTDVLIIPGATISFLEVIQNKNVLQWIRNIHETTRYTTSISSGSIILAAAGLLDKKTATSHWYSKRFLESYDVRISNKRYVQDGKIITSAGVTAGMDLALHLCEMLSDAETAHAIQLILEYEPEPHITAGFMKNADIKTIERAKRKIKDDAFRNSASSII